MAIKNGFLVAKLFDLSYSEYVWDSLSKWFIVQFYFTKSIATMKNRLGQKDFDFRNSEYQITRFVRFLYLRLNFCPRLFILVSQRRVLSHLINQVGNQSLQS